MVGGQQNFSVSHVGAAVNTMNMAASCPRSMRLRLSSFMRSLLCYYLCNVNSWPQTCKMRNAVAWSNIVSRDIFTCRSGRGMGRGKSPSPRPLPHMKNLYDPRD